MSLLPPWVNKQGGQAAAEAGWVERYLTDWSGDDTDFLAGGEGTTATFDGVTWTAHINQASGNGANKFESSSSGLEIDPDYQTRLLASASDPEWPGLWALIDDLVGGSWDGLSSVCIQMRINFDVAPSANFESGGLAIWEPTANWLVFVQPAYNGAQILWTGRMVPASTELKSSMTLPTIIEVHLLRGVLVDVYYGAWGGSWPTPGTLSQVTDASFVAKGNVDPGSSTNRPVSASTCRVAVLATNNNASNNIEMTCAGLRVCEFVG